MKYSRTLTQWNMQHHAILRAGEHVLLKAQAEARYLSTTQPSPLSYTPCILYIAIHFECVANILVVLDIW